MSAARCEWCGLSIGRRNLRLVLKGGVIFHWPSWWKWKRLLGAVDAYDAPGDDPAKG